MKTVVVVIAWNGREFVPACLDSLLAGRPAPRVLFVDNGSTDDTLPLARERVALFAAAGGELRFLELPENLGFTLAANRAMSTLLDEPGAPEAIVLLNQDTVVEAGWLEALLDALRRNPDAGAAGSRIRFPKSGLLQHAGGRLDPVRFVGTHEGEHRPDDDAPGSGERDVDFATGAALALRTAALREVGLFDEVFSPGYYEDLDLCRRLRTAGWRVIVADGARLVHHESGSFTDRFRRLTLSHRNRLILALPALAEEDGAGSFAEAERRFLEIEATPIEARAVAAGILELLLLFDRAVASRLGAEVPEERLRGMVERLSKLRHVALRAARNRG